MPADFRQLPSWQTLAKLAGNRRLASRDDELSILEPMSLGGLTVDMAKQLVSAEEWHSLLRLAEESNLQGAIERQFDGTFENRSEGKTVQHVRLRTPLASDEKLNDEVETERERMLDFAEGVRDGSLRGHTGRPISTVVNIGIGGSHLGPQVLVNAFPTSTIDVRFLANIDGLTLERTLRRLDPERTLVIVASKSFSTLEALENAGAVKSWFIERGAEGAIARQFIAVTERLDRAVAMGFSRESCFRLWGWTGGRYSIWSPIGLATAIAFGAPFFRAFLAGARKLDEHFRNADLADNLPIRLALTALWNSEFLDRGVHLVLPYDSRLAEIPTYLQQLELESNGKRVTADGDDIAGHTVPFIWGGEETNGQHAFHQFLLQGTRRFSADFVAVRTAPTRYDSHHRWLLANCFAQSEAMRFGNAPDTPPHRRVPGGTPSTTILFNELDAESIGAFLAMYEQKVFCLGHLWQINSFDQWGVELGKTLAEPIYEALAGSPTASHPATEPLIARIRNPGRD